MEQTTTTTSAAETGKRPAFLTVLCILSFVAAGLAIFGYITVLTLMGAATAVASNLDSVAGDSAASAALSEAMSKAPSAGLTWAYLVIGFLCTLVGLWGVIKMWKLQKLGFYVYCATSIVSVIMSMVYSGFGSAMMGLVFTILFIVLYGLNLKHMK